MTRKTILTTLVLIVIGGAGGAVANQVGIPMPWMLGALLASAGTVALTQHGPLRTYVFPQKLRNAFVALIGVMIGTQVTPELAKQLLNLPLTVAVLMLFVLMAHGGNHLIFRRVGGFDRPTAFYSATPGGLMESIMMGENVGADVKVLTIQQFLRIILVITLIPTGLSIWIGAPVGTAAGIVPGGSAPVPFNSLLLICIAAAVGLRLARLIRLPAAQLLGPLLLAAGLTLSDVVDLHLPFWLVAVAQVVIGVSLGLRFNGVTLALLRRSVGLSLLSVSYMLILGAVLSWGLHLATGIDFVHLLIGFAPGGVTEMSVIALSIAANPALVSMLHILRILMTVLELSVAAKYFGLRKAN